MERITADTVREDSSLRSAKLMRALTVPPAMAFFLITALYTAFGSNAFAAPIRYFEALFTLVLLPLLPYPLCAAFGSWKRKGRKLERSLAIVFSFIGYLMGTLFALLGGGTRIEIIVYLTYLISGTLMAVLSFGFRFKASGHACGAAGPFAMLAYSLSPWWLLGFLLMVPIFISSISLGRHNLGQLFAGAAVSVSALIIAVQLANLF